jgi:electron transport complex protein RnfG
LCLPGCQGETEPLPDLESDLETVELLQNVFIDTGYYYYDETTEIYWVYDSDQSKLGYAFYAEGMGVGVPGAEGLEKIAGPIIILVGIQDTETINKIYVISHHETPQLWNNLVRKGYLDLFSGLKVSDAYFTRDGGQVDVMSGATLSSTLVLETVRDTMLEKVALLESS